MPAVGATAPCCSCGCVVQVLGLPAPERFPTLLPVRSFTDESASLAMATSAGGIKRTDLAAFSKIHKNGLAAIKLDEVRAFTVTVSTYCEIVSVGDKEEVEAACMRRVCCHVIQPCLC